MLHPDAAFLALTTGVGYRRLDDLAALTVTGKDRASWLNGVVTNDVRALVPGRGVYAVAVGVKGKLLADLWVHPEPERLRLVMPRACRELVLAHFDRYLVMEDVTLTLDDAAVHSFQGPGAAALEARCPRASRADRLGRGGFDVLAADDDADFAAWRDAALAEGGAVAADDAAWERARVLANVPAWGRDFGPENYVQEASITPRAVSFQKGCYLGQEVVCRLEMRGHVQRQIVALRLEGAVPEAGAEVMHEDTVVGTVTSAVADPAEPGRVRALAMVRWAALDKAWPLRVGGAPATVIGA